MTIGIIIKLITLLLTLHDVGAVVNPNAPSAADVARYAPVHADAMVYIDLKALLPNNVKAFLSLPSNPNIQHDPKIRAAIAGAVTGIETGLNEIKRATGVDVVNDPNWAAGWMQVRDKGDLKLLLVVRGAFPKDLLNRIGATIGVKAKKQGAGTALSDPDGGALGVMMVGLTADGTLLVGTPSWVVPRLAKRWRSRTRLRQLTKTFKTNPFMVLASSPSTAAVRFYRHKLGAGFGAEIAATMLASHRFAALGIAHNGVIWDWRSRNRRGHRAAVEVSGGLIDVLRSGHLMSRGYAKLVLGILRSYADTNPVMASVSKHEAAILAAVEADTGDGNFKVKIESNAARRSLQVRAWGKKLSDVVPLSGLLFTAFGVGALAGAGSTAHGTTTSTPTPARAGRSTQATNHSPPPPPPPPPGGNKRKQPAVVPSTAVESNRISGTSRMVPSSAVKARMRRSKQAKLVTAVKMCLGRDGSVTRLTMLRSSGYASYDKSIKAKMRRWKYRPVKINRKPTPVCTAVTFIFTLQSPRRR